MAFTATSVEPHEAEDPFVLRWTMILPLLWRAVHIHDPSPSASVCALSGGRDDTEGEGSPSFKFTWGGKVRLRLAVNAGARSVTVRCKQAPEFVSPLAYARILANTSIGVNADVIAEAAPGGGWQTLGPMFFTPTQDGGVWLELSGPFDGGEGETWFDNVTIR